MSDSQNGSETPQESSTAVEKPKEEKKLLKDKFVKNGRNSTMICCEYCGAKILEKNCGVYMYDENATLPLMLQTVTTRAGVQKEPIKEFYHVENIYTFDNIGFTHAVDNYKYLSCADCDTGPLGYYDINTKHSYLALGRVKHSRVQSSNSSN